MLRALPTERAPRLEPEEEKPAEPAEGGEEPAEDAAAEEEPAAPRPDPAEVLAQHEDAGALAQLELMRAAPLLRELCGLT